MQHLGNDLFRLEQVCGHLGQGLLQLELVSGHLGEGLLELLSDSLQLLLLAHQLVLQSVDLDTN